jgi:hypothetical protein
VTWTTCTCSKASESDEGNVAEERGEDCGIDHPINQLTRLDLSTAIGIADGELRVISTPMEPPVISERGVSAGLFHGLHGGAVDIPHEVGVVQHPTEHTPDLFLSVNDGACLPEQDEKEEKEQTGKTTNGLS